MRWALLWVWWWSRERVAQADEGVGGQVGGRSGGEKGDGTALCRILLSILSCNDHPLARKGVTHCVAVQASQLPLLAEDGA
jgi:hypothetical protein